MKKIGFQRLLAAMGLLVIVLLAAAFILGILSLKRTQEIVSDDFQRQQLILAKATARQLEDGLAFLRRELKTLAPAQAVSYAIISKYGGNIRFESRAAGESAGGSTGTTFFIILQPETAAAHSTEARQAAN